MMEDVNPYSAPASTDSAADDGLDPVLGRVFRGRARVALWLGVSTSGTGVLLLFLFLVGAIPLGAFGSVIVGSLILSIVPFVIASKFYRHGNRKRAVAAMVIVTLGLILVIGFAIYLM